MLLKYGTYSAPATLMSDVKKGGILLFFLLCSVFSFAQNHELLKKIIFLSKHQGSISYYFGEIQQLGIILSYNPDEVSIDRSVEIKAAQLSVGALLNKLIDPTAFDIKVYDTKIVLVRKSRKKYTISGVVREAGSKESLVSASVLIVDLKQGVVSNDYGFYSITLPEGDYIIEYQYLGYISQRKNTRLTANTTINIDLEQDLPIELFPIFVDNKPLSESQVSKESINLQKTDNTPSALGIDDIGTRIQKYPGVNGGLSGISNLEVRGGNTDENLVLLDGVPVYNFNHFTGIVSVFNTDALKKVDFYKGLFPASYEGKLSSVLDVKMKEGDMHQYHGGVSLNLPTASGFFEGPIVKDKSSFIISGRRSLIDAISTAIDKKTNLGFSFYDVNVKTNYRINAKNHLYLGGYWGGDNFNRDIITGLKEKQLSWGNKLASFRWNHVFSDKLFNNLTLSASRFDNTHYSHSSALDEPLSATYSTSEYRIGSDFEYFGARASLKFGARAVFKESERPHYKALFGKEYKDFNDKKINAANILGYAEKAYALSDRLNAFVGFNYTLFHTGTKNFHSIQPRIKLLYQPNGKEVYFAGFSKMQQFLHQITSSGISLPHELRVISSANFPPSNSMLYEIGYKRRFREGKDEFYGSAYLKYQNRILKYRLQQNVLKGYFAPDWENQLISGIRRGRGVELYYSSQRKKLDYFVSYALSSSKEQFNELNYGKKFNAPQSVLHALKAFINYQILRSLKIGVVAGFSSGQYTTFPLYATNNIDEVLGLNRFSPSSINTHEIVHLYDFKLPDNYQLDFGASYFIKKHSTLRFGVNNILGRASPLFVMTDREGGQVTVNQITLPSFLPYITYIFRF